jgi:hypothetical protein
MHGENEKFIQNSSENLKDKEHLEHLDGRIPQKQLYKEGVCKLDVHCFAVALHTTQWWIPMNTIIIFRAPFQTRRFLTSCQTTNFLFRKVREPMLSGSPVTTAWRVLRLRMEKTAFRYGG